MDIKQNSYTASKPIFSQTSWQMNFFLILMIIVGIFYIYIAFEIKTYIALIYPVILGLIIPSLKFYSISFDNNIIQVKMLFYNKSKFYEEITSISITSSYGKFLIPGVPGFAITLGNEKFSKIINILFVGRKCPHELTKLFINAAIAKNPSIRISKDIINAYGQPPYLIDEDKLIKILNSQNPV